MCGLKLRPRRNSVRAETFFGLVLLALIVGPARGQNPPREPVQKELFENGLTVVTQKDPSSAITTLEILIKGGRRSEPPGQEGLSYLATRMALEIPDRTSIQDVMEKSARMTMISRGDYSLLHLECLSEYLDSTLKILSGILKDPLFTAIRIGRIVGFMTDQIKIESDDNFNVGHLALLRALLRAQGYAGSVFGEAEALKKLRSRDIEAFYNTYVTPENMIVVSISDLGREALLPTLKKYLGDLKPRKGPVLTRGQRRNEDRRISPSEEFLERDSAQTLVASGFSLPPISEKNYALAVLAESLLGRGPGSRLWPLRAEKKLAYNVNARATPMIEGGLLEAYLETDFSKTQAAREALASVLRDLGDRGIAPDELQIAKTFARADFLRSNEPKSSRSLTLGSFEALGLGAGYFERFLENMNGVTLGEINNFLRTVLDPANEAKVLVGRKK
jgi:zinc protease